MANEKMAFDKRELETIFGLLLEKEEELSESCFACLYFDCKKNKINKMLKKSFQEPPFIDYKQCLKETEKQRKEIKKLMKNKEFKEFKQEMQKGLNQIRRNIKQTKINRHRKNSGDIS